MLGCHGLEVALTTHALHHLTNDLLRILDIELHAKEILDLRKRLNEIYVQHTGQEIEKIEKALERDNFMTPDEAKEFGLLDHVVATRAETGDDEGETDTES